MPAQVHTGSGSRRRRVVSWSFCLLILFSGVLVGALLYLRWSGFPGFVKASLENRLRARGYSVQVNRARLQGFTVVAEGVRLAPANPASGPQAVLDRLELRLNSAALKRGHIAPERLIIEGGRVVWQTAQTNGLPRELSLEDVESELRFAPGDQFDLRQFKGRFLKAGVQATASITNAAALREWWTANRTAQPRTNWQQRLHEFILSTEQLALKEPSTVQITVQGDGRSPDQLQAELRVKTPQAVWPSGTIENLDLQAITVPANTGAGLSTVRLKLRLDRAAGGQWHGQGAALEAELAGSIASRSMSNLTWQLQLDAFQAHSITGRNAALFSTTLPSPSTDGQLRTELRLRADCVQSPWGSAPTNAVQLEIAHGTTQEHPWRAHWQWAAGPIESPWGQAAQALLTGHAAPRPPGQTTPPADGNWGFWKKLEPFELEWTGDFQEIKSPQLEVGSVSLAGQWQAPHVRVQNLVAHLYGGDCSATAALDVATRELRSTGALNFDVHQISPLLTAASRRWLSQFGWQLPPKVSGDVRLFLPSWTNREPQWREEVMPTIELAGDFEGSNGTFRGVPIAYARSHFALTNMVWSLPDLLARSPDGEAALQYVGDMRTHDYEWQVDGRMDPRALKPLFEEEGPRRVLEQFEFTDRPAVQASISGRWHEPESVSLSGRVALTNFHFRGELCHQLTGAVTLTNLVLGFSDVLVRRGAQEITVPTGRYDILERVVDVADAVSTMDPDLVTRVIGPKVRAAIQPYYFEKPPTVRVNGRLPTVNVQDANVRFEVAGEAFRYWKLRARSVMGDIHWRGDYLSISNVQASFYGGDLAWRGDFDFSVPVGAHFNFQGIVRNADFHALMSDFTPKTNNLQGTLYGRLTVSSANSDDWRSWQGSGQVQLQDGFLWDIPIFGFFSPILNGIIPGLGNSPISAGEATFGIDQSVVKTSDLELWSPALRLQYIGQVDLRGNVDARMQAEILRDAWGIGPVISLAFRPLSKAFEYQITGSLSNPKSEPVYIPRVLLWALHPVRTFKKLFVPGREEPAPEPGSNPLSAGKD